MPLPLNPPAGSPARIRRLWPYFFHRTSCQREPAAHPPEDAEEALRREELTDATRSRDAAVLSSSAAPRLTNSSHCVALQPIALARGAVRVGGLGLPAQHRLLFTALFSGLDTTLTAGEAALFGGASIACQHCIATVLEPRLSAAVASSPTAFPPDRNQHAHILLVAALARTPADAAVSETAIHLFEADLRRLTGEPPAFVLSSMLAIPSSPALLGALVDWVAAVANGGGGFDARLFSLVMNALLRNDNFFSRTSFAAMDSIVVDKVLARVGGAPFDYISVRWTPLMNKWARVYVGRGEGLALYRCFDRLLTAAPAAENKIPCSFYVRVIGGLIDVHGTTAAAESSDEVAVRADRGLWDRVVSVATRGVRLFGRSAPDMQALWVVLLKAALTLSPATDDWRRLLGAYHLCAAHGHQRPLSTDRGGFLQVVRLVSEALERLAGAPPQEAEEAVRLFCEFLREQETLSFLWLLDGVGMVLERLWESQGLVARTAAQALFATLRDALTVRGNVGVQLEANPALARALERFCLYDGGPPLFWWRCGCGTELPAAAKRCVTCLRHRPGVSWRCPRCAAEHRSPCAVQLCRCGEPNPRLVAAVQAHGSVCNACGEAVAAAGAACPRCQRLESRATAVRPCECCGAVNSANALYCPSCFAAPTDRPPLSLWRCDSCEDLNYSTWSACRRCQSQRRSGCLRLAFLPWRCGCGHLNHPCRSACSVCSAAGTAANRYTCRGCEATVEIGSGLEVVPLTLTTSLTLSAHFCNQCNTLHPLDQLMLYSPSLPRHCMRCASVVRGAGAVGMDGALYHCGLHQRVNEHVPFQCPHCERGTEWQTGFHCASCLQPRPEVEREASANPEAFFLWRCLRETDASDAATCGTWNYSWASHCRNCGEGRRGSTWECRARAYAWQCAACLHCNRALDVVTCASCQRSTQPILECDTCGVPHLTQACQQ